MDNELTPPPAQAVSAVNPAPSRVGTAAGQPGLTRIRFIEDRLGVIRKLHVRAASVCTLRRLTQTLSAEKIVVVESRLQLTIAPDIQVLLRVAHRDGVLTGARRVQLQAAVLAAIEGGE